MKQKILFFITLFLCSLSLSAQQQTELRGNVINSKTFEPVAGISLTLKGQSQTTTTDSKGAFHFMNVTSGEDILTLNSPNIVSNELTVNIKPNTVTILKDITVIIAADEDRTGSFDNFFADDDYDNSSQEISSLVTLSNDVYLNKIGYNLSAVRFKVRGYDSYYEQKFINGVSFNDQLRGVFNFASVGALNDVTRNGDVVNFQNNSLFTFGSIGGSENINMRAGSFGKGAKLTASYTNRNYYLRGMATYSTGLMDDGWAFTASIGGRYSDKGAIEGTFYRNISYALAIEKQWNEGKHSLSFTTFGSPVERGQQGSSTQEVYDLVDNNLYNPNWGYQDGKRRNSRVVKAYDPTGILSHIWKINSDITLTSGVGIHYGRYGGTALSWYNGPDPRPDYYRYLPSYFTDSEDAYNYYTELWKRNNALKTQINWDELYYANERANLTDNGNAVYMVEERRSDLFEVSLNSTINAIISKNHKINAGIGLRTTKSKQFKTVDDLLGAKHVLDIDKFAERDFPGDKQTIQNDLNHPDRKVIEGDIFGYNFHLNINSGNVWFQNQYTTSKLDFQYGAKVTYTEFQRDGKMRNGRYPTSSYGKGEKHTFVDLAARGGATYKITGRHLVTANVSYATEAPLPNNAYISPRISDYAIPNLKSGRVFSADLNYIFSLPSFNGRVSVFQTNFYDQVKRISYYHDAERTFINHVLTDMDKIHRGIEVGLAYKLDNNWSFDFAGTIAEYYYSNNPTGTMNSENGKVDNVVETVYMKNYYVGGTPQIAGTLGIKYFYDYWFLELKINGFARNYIDIAPLRRLASNYVNVGPDEYDAYQTIVHQERFDENYTLDFSVGKIFYLKNRNSINFNISVNNILNKKDIKTGGYEQGRINLDYPTRFSSKYYYMQGINCFVNVSYRF